MHRENSEIFVSCGSFERRFRVEIISAFTSFSEIAEKNGWTKILRNVIITDWKRDVVVTICRQCRCSLIESVWILIIVSSRGENDNHLRIM